MILEDKQNKATVKMVYNTQIAYKLKNQELKNATKTKNGKISTKTGKAFCNMLQGLIM